MLRRSNIITNNIKFSGPRHQNLHYRVRGREKIQKGHVSSMLQVPSHIPRPEYASNGQPFTASNKIVCYDSADIPKLRRAARLARKILEIGLKAAKPGVTTDEIDKLCHSEMINSGAYPSPLNYFGFPKSICTSVNEVICHGIPDNKPLQDGDLISIDVSLYIDGFHGDNCGSIVVGKGDPDLQKLIQITKDSVMNAIEICKPGACISNIGKTIERYANSKNCSVVSEFCGHGTGKFLHMKPLIFHYDNDTKLPMKPGMVFTIEPILVEGKPDIFTWTDDWTAATVDGSWGAQIEHEVLITENGVEILTELE